MATIAFLGTGLLGAAFAEAAAKRGDRVTVWNRSADKARALEGFGITVAASAADAVRGAARVHLVLKDDAVVDAVIAAARAGLASDAVLIDHSTTLPALTVDRTVALNGAGLKFLHAPVFMTPLAARTAKGSMLISGPRDVFDSVATELAAMTGRLEYQGERADLAAAKKLFGVTLKPPSPCTGSMMMAATRLGSMSHLKIFSRPLSASSSLTPCIGFGYGAWNTSPGKGPKPSLYGATLPVRPRVILVRPW